MCCLQAKVFQNSKDAVTGAPLDLPAVHFLCGHSFNVRSLGENEHECPLCAPQFRTILDIRRSMRAGATEQVPRAIVPEGLACMSGMVKNSRVHQVGENPGGLLAAGVMPLPARLDSKHLVGRACHDDSVLCWGLLAGRGELAPASGQEQQDVPELLPHG